ncbi:hypothetical protein OIV83_001659 [Microbotryomycetes sp. JL201]|nr:hypothetical protein OIV83_001659 [Microbotryomycetes sp. JL201]
MQAAPGAIETTVDYSDISDSEDEQKPNVGGSNAQAGGRSKCKKDKDKEDKKRRSSKACDTCRKSKTKCTRVIDPGTNQPAGPCTNCIQAGTECTSLGASRKRGPPKGYIEAIESRLHRMEALLGGLLQNDDPRAAHLLGELIGNEEARDVLTRDLRAAANSEPGSKPRKSWKKHEETPAAASASIAANQQSPIASRGFSTAATVADLSLPPQPHTWLTEEDLGIGSSAGINMGGGSSTSTSGFNALGFGPTQTGGSPIAMGQGQSPTMYGGMESTAAEQSAGGPSGTLPPASNPRSPPIAIGTTSLSLPGIGRPETSTSVSPRQRRRLNEPPSLSGTSQLVGTDVSELKTMAFGFGQQTQQNIPPTAINHTGTASYHLSADAELVQQEEMTEENAAGGSMSELADVVGQLSLNENAEVRYHGRSSGLYLISKSARYKDFFWQFPSAGVWPALDGQKHKSEREILALADAEDPLPDRATQQHLLDLYWTYVHPHFPILYKVSFMRQYRHTVSNPDSIEPSTPAGGGKVPMVLLLSMFALAARYSDLDPVRSDGKYWTAGQDYFEKAKRVLNYDYGSSKLVSVQALLLLAYREIGTGAMSASWLFTGMAIRMAQDLGLFRDVEKWFLPVSKFSHEEKQTRKRVWWGCIILDRYTASYIGRPGTIHERDYDTSFPSEDEPDEHEQWRPIRPDGTDWSVPPRHPDSEPSTVQRYPPTKAHTLSCFNASGALAVVINRIISNIYAIRIRVLGQSSETLLSLLDQSLASWYLALPPHLAYNPASKKVPPPHVLALHLKFYSALILLHRPFIPGQNSRAAPGRSFPSHSICTTSATAIANIVTIFRKTYTLRQCPPFLTYPIFSAAVICVYNASFDDALARPAKVHLAQCMTALKEMELIWGSAIRQWELLHGLVDLKDAELNAELERGLHTEDNLRGTKRPADTESTNFSNLMPTNFHSKPMGRFGTPAHNKPRRRSSSGARSKGDHAKHNLAQTQSSPTIPEDATLPSISSTLGTVSGSHQQQPVSGMANLPNSTMFEQRPISSDSFGMPSAASAQNLNLNLVAMPPQQLQAMAQQRAQQSQQQSQQEQQTTPFAHGSHTAGGVPLGPGGLPHQTYDILSASGPAFDLSQFRSPPGSSGGVNFTDLLNSFLTPTEAASAANLNQMVTAATQSGTAAPDMSGFDTSAFFGMPLSANLTDEWAAYLPQAFFSPGTDQNAAMNHSSASPPAAGSSPVQPSNASAAST